jgi:hydrogenase maturation factor
MGKILMHSSYIFAPRRRNDYTIVHLGFALSKIDEAEALRAQEVFRQMGCWRRAPLWAPTA